MINSQKFLNNIQFEEAPCDFCGSTQSSLLFSGPDLSLKLPGVFKLVVCKQCGMIRQNPRPTSDTIRYYYNNAYEPYLPAIAEEKSAWRRLNRQYGMSKRWRLISRRKSEGRLLDIGCAAGNFLYEAYRHGNWLVQGVEPDEKMAAYGRDYYGFDIFQGTFDAYQAPENSFDVITMWNVLEHLHFPNQSLKKIHRLLKSDGLLVFSIPNTNSLDAKWFDKVWFGWELPRHLYHFPQSALLNKLTQMGFYVEDIRCLWGTYELFSLSAIQFLETRNNGCLTLMQRRFVDVMRSSLARLLVAPIFWGIDKINLGDLHTYVVKKC